MVQRERPQENLVSLIAVKDVVDALTQPVHGEESAAHTQGRGESVCNGFQLWRMALCLARCAAGLSTKLPSVRDAKIAGVARCHAQIGYCANMASRRFATSRAIRPVTS
jgi:hypothetical protein